MAGYVDVVLVPNHLMRLQSCELAHQQLELNPAAHSARAHTERSCVRSAHLALALILLLLPSFLSPTPAAAEDDSSAAAGAIVISEIHYEPADKQAHVEFVELYNASSAPIDLSGWAFTEGIRYEFAQGVILAPGRYLVVAADPARLLQRYRVPALGPFTGRLANEGEQLVLRNSQADEVDSVEYGVGFPWPIGGSDNDLSINLVNAALDNSIPGAWRAGGATCRWNRHGQRRDWASCNVVLTGSWCWRASAWRSGWCWWSSDSVPR